MSPRGQGATHPPGSHGERGETRVPPRGGTAPSPQAKKGQPWGGAPVQPGGRAALRPRGGSEPWPGGCQEETNRPTEAWAS